MGIKIKKACVCAAVLAGVFYHSLSFAWEMGATANAVGASAASARAFPSNLQSNTGAVGAMGGSSAGGLGLGVGSGASIGAIAVAAGSAA